MRHANIVLLVAAALAAACSPALAQRPTAAAADSLVLERTLCYGICPAYRVSLTAAGRVSFVSRNPDDTTRGFDAVPPATLATLVRRAEALGFFALPDRLLGDPSLCPLAATDHATATLTIFRAAGVKVVEDYQGCFARAVDVVGRLRALETAVDSAVGSRRWARPARRR